MEIIKPPRGVQLDKSHPLNRGLVACYLFNEGDGKKVFDLSGNGNLGTLHNMAFPSTAVSGWNAGRRGVGLKFDGADDYVDCGNGSSLDFVNEFTYSAWIKTNTISDGYKVIIIHRKYANDGVSVALFLNDADVYCDIKNDDRSFSVDGLAGVSLSINTWYHIVLTTDYSGSVDIWVNGTKYNIGSNANGPYSNYDLSLEIGRHKNINNPSGAQFFNGQIDEVRVYNRALSAEEIKTLYLYPYAGFQQPCTAWLYAAAAGGLSIPVAMHNYRRMRT